MKIPSEKELTVLRKRLFSWFDKNGRSLPWRKLDVPSNNSEYDNNEFAYRVWVSEIMLQQTTTKTVQGYFDRFMALFPSILTLANADISDVLHLWEGLGYYRRAHLLHRAAQSLKNDYHGVFPKTMKEVLALPGIGRYTAGAILSIAFDQRVPILEANTIRLHSRLIGLEEDPSATESSKILWNFAETILPKKYCGKFNQILMDLGSLICLPGTPQCSQCPAISCCEAARLGKQNQIPYFCQKIKKEYRQEIAFFIHEQDRCSRKTTSNFMKNSANREKDRFLLIRYPEGGRWTGLWDFPRFLLDSDAELDYNRDLRKKLALLLDNNGTPLLNNVPGFGPLLKTIRHTVTKYCITLLFHDTIPDNCSLLDLNISPEDSICLASGEFLLNNIEKRWVSLQEATVLPLSSTGRKLIRFLSSQ